MKVELFSAFNAILPFPEPKEPPDVLRLILDSVRIKIVFYRYCKAESLLVEVHPLVGHVLVPDGDRRIVVVQQLEKLYDGKGQDYCRDDDSEHPTRTRVDHIFASKVELW